MLAYAAGWLVVIYFVLRLAVWPASVVATGRLSPVEAWRLTRGNVWRLIGLFVLTAIVIWIVVVPPVAAYFYQVKMDAGPMMQPGGPLDPEALKQASDPAAMRELMRQAMERQMQPLQPYAPLFWLGYLLFTSFHRPLHRPHQLFLQSAERLRREATDTGGGLAGGKRPKLLMRITLIVLTPISWSGR